tara:strand:- start:211 stop:762 length:552 start_codon:yes stop_codon:yes gene_type:complete
MSSINDFRTALEGGGARANQFQIVFNTPSRIPNFQGKHSFLVRTGQLPGSSVGEVVVPFRGRALYLAGDREYEPWTTTVLNDNDFHVRNIIETWQNFMNDYSDGRGSVDVSTYTADILVRQLDRNAESGEDFIKQYKLINCFPQAVGAIDLSYDATTEVETFDITWRYSHFEIEPFTEVSIPT